MLLYFSSAARHRREHHRLALRPAAGRRGGRAAARRLAVRSLRPAAARWSPTTSSRRSASSLFLAAGSNLALLVPLLLPFGTAVFTESPVLQAYLADRASGPIRDVAFSVYFTFAFGIGAFWAFVIGTVIAEFGLPGRVRRDGRLLRGRGRSADPHPRAISIQSDNRLIKGRRQHPATYPAGRQTRTSSRPGRSGIRQSPSSGPRSVHSGPGAAGLERTGLVPTPCLNAQP